MLREIWSDLRYRVRALVRRDGLERDLDAELRFHLERETEKHLAMGLSPDEARRRARLAFGGLERAKEESREARGVVLLETTLQDVRYALRGLRAKPVFTAGVVLTLALGIGANAAMFGIVDRLLFRSPPFLRDASRVHRVYLRFIRDGGEVITRGMSVPRFVDLTRNTHSFSDVAGFQVRTLPVGTGESARDMRVGVVSGRFFSFFDAPPTLGRYFAADEDRMPQGVPVVVLGYGFWQTEYGGRRDILGTRIQVDRMNCTIVGVAPQHFVGVSDRVTPAMYVPLSAYAFSFRGPNYPTQYGWSWMEMLVRRKASVTPDQAAADLNAAYQRSWTLDKGNATQNPIGSARPRALLAPVQLARGPQAGRDSKVATWVSGVAMIVLLIACANVANLLLSRAVKRRREMALRLALGVSRTRLVRQLLTESLVLAAAGGVAGLAIAQWGGGALRALYFPNDRAAGVLADGRTVLFALAATLGASLLTGVAPAIQASRADLARTLNAAGREADARGGSTRTLLLLVQTALSFVLLIGAGVFVRSLHNVQTMRLGYDVDPLVLVQANMRGVRLEDAPAIALETRLVDAARTMPGVLSATPVVSVPFYSNEQRTMLVPGIDSVGNLGMFLLQAGTPDYFATMGTRIIRGRAFDASDGLSSASVMVVSEAMARVLWPGEDPLGKCVRFDADNAPCTTVIGVAEEMRLRSLSAEKEFTYYIPYAQYGGAAGALLVRVAGEPAAYTNALRQRLQPLMPGAAYVTVQPLRELIDPTMQSWRFGATMFAAFGGLALALAAIGLYSVIAYGVAQRRRELGVRIALGATRPNVIRLVVGTGIRLVVIGVVIGGVIAFWAGKWVEALLFQQSARDPAVFAVVSGVLIAVALVATAVPAFAASRVDPNIALRAE